MLKKILTVIACAVVVASCNATLPASGAIRNRGVMAGVESKREGYDAINIKNHTRGRGFLCSSKGSFLKKKRRAAISEKSVWVFGCLGVYVLWILKGR